MTETINEIRKQSRRMWGTIIILFVLIFANFGIAFARPDSTTQTIIGPVGPVGQQGAQGASGKDGKDGIEGPQGPVGPAGPQGPQGLQGIQGLLGPMGFPGADGKDGANGKDGLDGINGTNGRNVELRGNDTDKTIEWRLEGDPDWHVLTQYCQLTNACVATPTAD